jgi:hypothetical protein
VENPKQRPPRAMPGTGEAEWRPILWRYSAYVLGVALTAESIVVAAEAGWLSSVGRETGPIEYAHQALCGLAAIAFARAAVVRPELRDILAVAAYGATLGVIRETDALLDHLAFKGAYKVPAAVVGAFALARLWRARSRCAEQLRRFAGEPGFAITAIGVLVVLLYAQLVGQKELWMAIMGVDYARPVKDAAEELQELLGYLLIFIGSIETYLVARRHRPDSSDASVARRSE